VRASAFEDLSDERPVIDRLEPIEDDGRDRLLQLRCSLVGVVDELQQQGVALMWCKSDPVVKQQARDVGDRPHEHAPGQGDLFGELTETTRAHDGGEHVVVCTSA
jgi:hypothetical protein